MLRKFGVERRGDVERNRDGFAQIMQFGFRNDGRLGAVRFADDAVSGRRGKPQGRGRGVIAFEFDFHADKDFRGRAFRTVGNGVLNVRRTEGRAFDEIAVGGGLNAGIGVREGR